jgi:hypothetical protein
MPWLKVSDVAAQHPVVQRPLLEAPPADVDAFDMVNLAFGLVTRCATSAAGYRTDYRVDDATVAMMGGPNWRARAELAERAGYWQRTDDGGWVILDDPDNFLHIRLKSELEWEAARKKDTANPSLIVPVRLRDGDGCRYCGVIVTWGVQRGGRGGTYDHAVPGKAATSPDDLRVCCRQCNTRRGTDPTADRWMPPQPSPAEPHYGTKTVALLAEHGHRVPRSRSRRGTATDPRPGTQPDTATTAERPAAQADTAHPRDPATGGTPRLATPPPAHRDATALQMHDNGPSERRDPAPTGTPREQPKLAVHRGSAKTANQGTTGSQNPGRVGSGREPTYPNPAPTSRRRRGRRGRALPAEPEDR